MAEKYSLVIRGARIVGRAGLYDIAVEDGVIAGIGDRVSGRGELEIDAGGGLVTGPYVNPHLHLCKVYTLEEAGWSALRLYQGGGMEGSMRAIEEASRVKEKYTREMVARNAERALREAVRHGTLYIRAFADTDPRAGLEAVKALIDLREKYRGIIDIQVVAFPQDGILREPGTEELLWKAAELGVDVVGGIPWIELTRGDMERHIGVVFDIAVENDLDVAMLTDDTGDPTLETTMMLAEETLRRGWRGRVTACHARALALKPAPYIDRLSRLLERAGVSIVTDPHTGPLHVPIRRLLANNVNVALGQDDINDAYYPYGRNNMLEVAFLASHIAWMMDGEGIGILYDMITWRAARAMNTVYPRIEPGAPADLLVHRHRSIHELVWMHEPPLYVIRNGAIIYHRSVEEEFSFPVGGMHG